jgi:hypothetical protein
MLEPVFHVLELLKCRWVQVLGANVSVLANSQHEVHVQDREECCTDSAGLSNCLWGLCCSKKLLCVSGTAASKVGKNSWKMSLAVGDHEL